jgi:hypothetical protein
MIRVTRLGHCLGNLNSSLENYCRYIIAQFLDYFFDGKGDVLRYILSDFFTNSSGHHGPNPTIVSYKASVVKNYNSMCSLCR